MLKVLLFFAPFVVDISLDPVVELAKSIYFLNLNSAVLVYVIS